MNHYNEMDSQQNLHFWFVSPEHNPLATANFPQIISPVVITIGYFSMPKSAVLFDLNNKSFTITVFVIMAVMKLLLVVPCVLPREPLWWSKITAWIRIRAWQLYPTANSRFALRRDIRNPDRTSDGVDMEVLEV